MSTDPLTVRLERLERSYVRLKRVATVLGLLLAATFAGAMNEDEVSDIVRAKQFEVVGASGSVLRLYAHEAGGAELTMRNAAGTVVVRAFALSAGARFEFCNGETGEAVALVNADKWRGGHVWVGSGEGTGGVSIGTTKDGGSIEVRREPHRVNSSRVLLEATAGGGALVIRDASERIRFRAEVAEDSGGVVHLWRPDGAQRTLGVSND